MSLREVLTGPRYELKDFLVPASDTKGHSVPIGLRCTGEMMRNVQVILASNKFPYKTTSDLLRHGFLRHIRWLISLEPEISESMDYMDIIMELAKTQQMHLKFLASIQSIGDTVEKLLQEGMKSEAKFMVQKILEKLDSHSSNDVWKKKLYGDIKKRFKHLLPKAGAGTVPE